MVNHRAVDDDVGLALEDDEEVRAGEPLGEHAVTSKGDRVVETFGCVANLFTSSPAKSGLCSSVGITSSRTVAMAISLHLAPTAPWWPV